MSANNLKNAALILLAIVGAVVYFYLRDHSNKAYRPLGSLLWVFILGFSAARMIREKGEWGHFSNEEKVVRISSSNVVTLVLIGLAVGLSTGYILNDIIHIRPSMVALAAVIFLAFIAADLIGKKKRGRQL